MHQENNIDDALIAKFLAGEATPEEAMSVTEWIDRSEGHRALFEQSERALFSHNYVAVSTENKKTIHQSIVAGKSSRSVFFTPLRLAAAVLILISVSAVVYLMLPKPSIADDAWITKNSNEEVYTLPLAEGSAIVLNKKSTLVYPKEFNGQTRTVKLTGEAFFDVAHNATQPFVVHCDEVSIKVLGTAFNVNCVKDKTIIETQVTRGKVMMYTSYKSINIDAGWIGRYDRTSKQLSLRKAHTENHVGYATHTFTFEDASLKEVTHDLSNSFGVTFVFENEKLKDCGLTTTYNNKPLNFILDVIAESLNLKYRVEGNTVYLSGDGCL